jgi:hypothetical protein
MRSPIRVVRAVAALLQILTLAPLVAVAVPADSALARAGGEVTFSIGEGVAPEDEMLIREGVRLAQDFLADELGVEVRERTIVNARATTPDDAPLIGMAGMNWVGLYTASEGWRLSPPAYRLHVVVHEFVHVAQHELIGGTEPVTPLWLDEGLAEYLAYRALASHGLVDPEDVDAIQAFALSYGPWLPGLADLESYEGFQSQDGTVYALAFLATQTLVDALDLGDVTAYYEAIGDGVAWQEAFAAAFGIGPAAFYDAFAQRRAAIVAPADLPRSYQPIDPVEVAAVVWPAPADPVARGDQVVLLAKTDPAARCLLDVTSPAGQPTHVQPAYADANGLVFWLWTVPAETNRGTAKATLSCGGPSVTIKVRIA